MRSDSRLRAAIVHDDRAALIAYVCAGDPDLATTAKLIPALARAGADVVEVGVPFSDPTADGISIQRASERSLRAGTTLPGVLDAIRVARRETDVPIVLFGYYNPILARGEERVVALAADAGVDGFLVVDLPPEDAAPLLSPLAARSLGFVPLVAPTSTEARIDAAARAASGFLYYVSLTGVTGAKVADLDVAAARAATVRARTGIPVALGFGIRTAADVRRVAPHVDAVVVGSAIVETIARAANGDEAVAAAAALTRELREATAR